MRYDRETRYASRRRARPQERPGGRGEYGTEYEGPSEAGQHGFGMGYGGGALRSRGSYQAGQLRSGLNPRDEFEFEWGGGYIGGRGYGGTNYDYRHGYRVGGPTRVSRAASASERPSQGDGTVPGTSPATRGGFDWGEREEAILEPYGPSRYGYGPYYERLQRRRRPDDEIRREIEDTLFYDTWVDADRITVEVEDGIVTLRGSLPNHHEVRYATDDAWDVDGVRGVRSALSVEEEGRERQTGERESTARGPAGEAGAGRGQAERGARRAESAAAMAAGEAAGEAGRRGAGRRGGRGAAGSGQTPPGSAGETRSAESPEP